MAELVPITRANWRDAAIRVGEGLRERCSTYSSTLGYQSNGHGRAALR